MRNGVAALHESYGLATAWNPNPPRYNSWVRALAVSGSTIYVGGEFGFIGGYTRHNVAGLHAGSGTATPWHPNLRGTIDALAVSGTAVYVGG